MSNGIVSGAVALIAIACAAPAVAQGQSAPHSHEQPVVPEGRDVAPGMPMNSIDQRRQSCEKAAEAMQPHLSPQGRPDFLRACVEGNRG